MKHFTIAYKDSDDNFQEICEYAERSDEAIKNAINDIPILKNNDHYIFRCTNESDLEWLSNMERLSKKEWGNDMLTKRGSFTIEDIKNQLTRLFHRLKPYFKSAFDL